MKIETTASLPMYAHPALEESHRVYWALIRDSLCDHGIAAPDALGTGYGLEYWCSPSMVLSQTCGFPFRRYLHNKVHLVGTPDYGLPECPAGYYQSVIVTRLDDARAVTEIYSNGCVAVNGYDSESGYATLRRHFSDLIPSQWHVSGAHLASARAVAAGHADMAALDAVSWRIFQCYEPALCANLSVQARTKPTPGLPYITAKGYDPVIVRAAVIQAMNALPTGSLNNLMIKGLTDIAADAYLSLSDETSDQSGSFPNY